MRFIGRLLFRTILTAAALYIAQNYIPGFSLIGGWQALILASVVIVVLNVFLRPLLKLIFFPVISLTLGLFAVVINMGILWLADQFLDSLSIAKFSTLLLTSILVGIANSIL